MQARHVQQDVELHGQKVAEGSIMVILNGSANRDERHYPDGDSFDIHRDVGRHLSFGYGIHLCLGAALARLEGRIALDEVLRRFPDWEVDYDKAQRAHASTVRGWETLPVSHVREVSMEEGSTAMNLDDMILVSIDDHMIEPPHMFENHVPKKWLDDAPEGRPRRTASTSGSSRARRPARHSGWPPRWAGPPRSGASTRGRTPSCGPAASTCTSGSAT